ncbi:PTS system mannose/fructose/N-acetylgalactosamine-transporter subunit IIB [Geoalkalibacter sp.]|uniref:PTS system mannose/fructose/N-acetylgalactosamine-transporter subunit IIB n=1 Tax=Geoalkalibacter sp. TaxID=3041440 RepID=UPI00272DD489|nr:PTS sugar transporter subunit IIB [Geoalkalibacter sp.]
MGIVLARIDNRLIHGQVLEAWIPFTHANCIVVANDELARPSLRRAMMEASVPRSIKVIIGDVEDISLRLRDPALAKERVLLLFASSADALRAHRRGVVFKELNLGNMHEGQGKYQLSCTIHLDEEDVKNLIFLEQEGVEIVSRCIPADRGQHWKKLVRNMPG